MVADIFTASVGLGGELHEFARGSQELKINPGGALTSCGGRGSVTEVQ